MDQENKSKKVKKTRRPPPPLPMAPDSHPVLKKEKTYQGNYVDENETDEDYRYLDGKNKSRSQEQFSKKAKKKKQNYSDYEANKVDSDNENHFYDNPDYVFNFDDFDTGNRPDPFYDEGDHDPIFEKIRIHLNILSANSSPKVSPRSNSVPLNIITESKKEEKNVSVRNEKSDTVMKIRDHEGQFKFSSDNETSEPKEKKKKKKGRKKASSKKKAPLNDDE